MARISTRTRSRRDVLKKILLPPGPSGNGILTFFMVWKTNVLSAEIIDNARVKGSTIDRPCHLMYLQKDSGN